MSFIALDSTRDTFRKLENDLQIAWANFRANPTEANAESLNQIQAATADAFTDYMVEKESGN